MAGSIRERAPGQWEMRVLIGKDANTGKARQITRTYMADRREPGAGKRTAEKKLAALVTAVERGEHGGTKATFGILLDEWPAHSERIGRSPKTLHEYRRKINTSIRPTLGARSLDKLTALDLDRLYADQLAAGRPGPRNPELATIIILAVLTGMRRGQLCGLQWSDVDWKSALAVVRRSIWQTADGIGTKGPKSHQARRLVLGEQAMEVLGGRHAQALADASVALVALSPGEVRPEDPRCRPVAISAS